MNTASPVTPSSPLREGEFVGFPLNGTHKFCELISLAGFRFTYNSFSAQFYLIGKHWHSLISKHWPEYRWEKGRERRHNVVADLKEGFETFFVYGKQTDLVFKGVPFVFNFIGSRGYPFGCVYRRRFLFVRVRFLASRGLRGDVIVRTNGRGSVKSLQKSSKSYLVRQDFQFLRRTFNRHCS